MATNWKDIERAAKRLETLARLRLEIAELQAAKRTPETDDELEALQAWERQIADWHSRM